MAASLGLGAGGVESTVHTADAAKELDDEQLLVALMSILLS